MKSKLILVGLLVIGCGFTMAPNRRPFDHIGSYNFAVEIEGVTQGSFREVGGLVTSTEVIEFANGDDIILRKRPGRTRYGNIVLKRGYINNTELWDWSKAVQDGTVERKSGSIILNADDGSEIMRYNFFEGWPAKWKGFRLNANKPGVNIEEVEIAIERIERG